MSNPFNSDYITANSTVTNRDSKVPTSVKSDALGSNVTSSLASETAVRAYGYEPERYGLGKPKRVVTRGKIARE